MEGKYIFHKSVQEQEKKLGIPTPRFEYKGRKIRQWNIARSSLKSKAQRRKFRMPCAKNLRIKSKTLTWERDEITRPMGEGSRIWGSDWKGSKRSRLLLIFWSSPSLGKIMVSPPRRKMLCRVIGIFFGVVHLYRGIKSAEDAEQSCWPEEWGWSVTSTAEDPRSGSSWWTGEGRNTSPSPFSPGAD